MGTNRHAWLWGALFAALLHPAAAHNWVNTPSRAQVAAVNIPCVARVDPAPHLQVAPGQKFQLEWSTGHGETSTAWTYFVFLSDDNYDKLVPLDDSLLDDYLSKAPSYLTGNQWARHHLSPWANYQNGCTNCNHGSANPGTFAAVLSPTDTRYVTRNNVAVKKSFRANDVNVTQFWYPAAETNGDRRAEYKSPKYPWILSVHKFHVPAHWPDEYDIATFQFPTGLPTGNYIAHFKWGGYRDCTDVHIVTGTTPVANLWGALNPPNGTNNYARLDHCEYTFVLNPSTKCNRVINGNASQCMADCLKSALCSGVQVVRKTNPAGTLPYTPNFPYKKWTDAGATPPDEKGPCDSRTIHKRRTCPDITPTCNNASLDNVPDNGYLCYGLKPFHDMNLQTVDDYVITTDPRDPGFYSTCFVRLSPGGFLPYPVPKKPAPVWKTGDKCVSCDWLKNTYDNLATGVAPDWTQALTTECRNCDVVPTQCPAAEAVDFIDGGVVGNCTGTLKAGDICNAQCNSGYSLFGNPRSCQNGLLTGASQKCVFGGC